MRRARHLLWILALTALTSAPAAHATSVTVQMSGTWDTVIDNANATQGAIAAGISFTVLFTYNDATIDSNPSDLTLGDYLLLAAESDYTIATGGFTFSLLPAQNIIFSVGNSYNGADDVALFAQQFSTTGPLLPGLSTGNANSSISVVDSTQTAHSSDSLSALPWDVDLYNSPNQGMYFLAQVLGAGGGKKIELFGEFTSFQVLPEPSTVLLSLVALGIFAATRHRG
jgi:hypothetical protein